MSLLINSVDLCGPRLQGPRWLCRKPTDVGWRNVEPRLMDIKGSSGLLQNNRCVWVDFLYRKVCLDVPPVLGGLCWSLRRWWQISSSTIAWRDTYFWLILGPLSDLRVSFSSAVIFCCNTKTEKPLKLVYSHTQGGLRQLGIFKWTICQFDTEVRQMAICWTLADIPHLSRLLRLWWDDRSLLEERGGGRRVGW